MKQPTQQKTAKQADDSAPRSGGGRGINYRVRRGGRAAGNRNVLLLVPSADQVSALAEQS